MRLTLSQRHRGRIYAALNLLFTIAAIALTINLFLIWRSPVLPEAGPADNLRRPEGAEMKKVSRQADYRVIADKDIFRPERQKFIPVVKAKPKPAPPPQRKAPPILKLVGTVLLDNNEAAIIDYAGGGQAPSRYNVGDAIEEFVIKKIRKDLVILERDDGMVLTVGSKAPAQGGTAGVQRDQPVLSGGKSAPRSDIPPALIPGRHHPEQ